MDNRHFVIAVGGAEPEAAVGGAVPEAAVGGAVPEAAVGGAVPEAAVGGAVPEAAVGGADPDAEVGGADPDAAVEGGGADDVVEGGGADDVVEGGGADDVVEGGGADDVVEGGGADDVVEGGGVVDELRENIPDEDSGVDELRENISDEDRGVDSYREIENLWRINEHRNPLFKLALAEWIRTEQELDHRQSRRVSKSIDLHTQIHNIIGWYAVFQGVLLTAVSQLTASPGVPVCGKIWYPILLTGFGTLVTIVGVYRLFSDLKSLETTINSEKKTRGEAAHRVSTLRRLGPQEFSFKNNTSNSLKYPEQDFWRNKVAAIVSLLVFTGLFILSYFVILCDTWVIRKWDKGLPGY